MMAGLLIRSTDSSTTTGTLVTYRVVQSLKLRARLVLLV